MLALASSQFWSESPFVAFRIINRFNIHYILRFSVALDIVNRECNDDAKTNIHRYINS